MSVLYPVYLQHQRDVGIEIEVLVKFFSPVYETNIENSSLPLATEFPCEVLNEKVTD